MRRDARTARNHFVHSLAEATAEYLAGWDTDLTAVYLYGQDLASDDTHVRAAAFHPLYLIVWAERKTAALNSLITMLDRALVQELGKLLGRPAPARVLDVQLIDDADVSGRLGSAAFLLSPHHRPTRVWGREDLTRTGAKGL